MTDANQLPRPLQTHSAVPSHTSVGWSGGIRYNEMSSGHSQITWCNVYRQQWWGLT